MADKVSPLSYRNDKVKFDSEPSSYIPFVSICRSHEAAGTIVLDMMVVLPVDPRYIDPLCAGLVVPVFAATAVAHPPPLPLYGTTAHSARRLCLPRAESCTIVHTVENVGTVEFPSFVSRVRAILRQQLLPAKLLNLHEAL